MLTIRSPLSRGRSFCCRPRHCIEFPEKNNIDYGAPSQVRVSVEHREGVLSREGLLEMYEKLRVVSAKERVSDGGDKGPLESSGNGNGEAA